MTIELTKEVAVDLLKGTTPNYNVMDKIPKELGRFVGGFVDEWEWYNFSDRVSYSAEELYDLYLICKNSWKE